MTSPKQIAANQRNAQRSTGPRSPEGKQISKLNAVKHGATAALICVPGEDPQAFEDWRQMLVDWHQPKGPEENHLVDRIATLQWKLKRIPRAEAALITYDYWEREQSRHRATANRIENSLEDYGIWEEDDNQDGASLSSEDQELYDQAVLAMEKAEAATETEAIRFGEALTASLKTLTLLNRYEVAIERSLVRTSAELERLQERRGRSQETSEFEEGPSLMSDATVIDLTANKLD